VLVTGHVGPKAFATLQEGHVNIFTSTTGTVQDAVEQYKLGQLECADQKNITNHLT